MKYKICNFEAEKRCVDWGCVFMYKKPLLLMILDGWGLAPPSPGNAIAQAKTPNFDRLWEQCPHSTLGASGLDVGLPAGQMGNSEVGHMNMGAGRVVYQDLTLLNKEIAEGSFFHNPQLVAAMAEARAQDRALHLLGLVSDGGVHSHIAHVYALLRMAKEQGLTKVYLHCITDGRDTDPSCALTFISQLEQFCQTLGVGRIATVMGRFYAMDRDNRWNRIQRAYQAIVQGEGHRAPNASSAVLASYAAGATDEFIEPAVIEEAGQPVARIQDGDSVIFFNFRADRPRELTYALRDPDFMGFDRGTSFPQTHFVTMTQYDAQMTWVSVAYPPHQLVNTFGQIVADHGMRQLRIAETEKYAHVTFFFNGGVEEPLPGEDRILIPSPKVATYDLQPEMSAPLVADAVLDQLSTGKYDVIILNFANPDMVGHTGIVPAAIRAVEAVDACIGQVEQAIRAAGGKMLITADHGNAEQMMDGAEPVTAHSVNRVPFILLDEKTEYSLVDGRLEDIAPTMLELMGLDQPKEMTGHSLLVRG